MQSTIVRIRRCAIGHSPLRHSGRCGQHTFGWSAGVGTNVDLLPDVRPRTTTLAVGQGMIVGSWPSSDSASQCFAIRGGPGIEIVGTAPTTLSPFHAYERDAAWRRTMGKRYVLRSPPTNEMEDAMRIR